MKKLCLAALAAIGLLAYSCNGSSDKTENAAASDSTSAMMGSDTANTMTNKMSAVDDNTKDFAKDATEGGMVEIALGNIAQKNSKTQSIKDFGKMMVDDHTQLNDQIKDLASKKMVDLPSAVTDDQQKDIDKLAKETGSAFDKDYVSMMVKGHKKVLADFKSAGDKITDPDFKDLIMKALPTIQKHLDAVEAIQKKM